MSSPEDEVGDPQLPIGSFQSKLPLPDKTKTDDGALSSPLDILSKMIGLDTLYGVLSEEHLGLQLLLKDTLKKLKAEEKSRKEAEGRLQNHNPINVALAERIQALEESEARLKRENKDLREENDLLEFRVLEMEDSIPPKRTPTRTPDPGRLPELGRFPDLRSEFPEMDDVSDSGVMSLPTSDDEHHEFNLDGVKADDECSKQLRLYGPYQEARCDRDVKSRLLSMCQSAGTVSERICLQQALALLRHYEARIEGLESTIAAMCHEATMSRSLAHKAETSTEPDTAKSSGKIVATVLPFSEAGSSSSGKLASSESRKDLTESGIFDDNLVSSRGTQTDSKKWQTADLTAELEKLSRIRERIETGGKPLQTPKDLTYYEKRIEALQGRLAVYESSDDEQAKALRSVLSRSTQLTAQVTHLQEKISRLEKENIRLEEERSELEELENDARLRCQRLESKLSSLGEKKRSLKTQLEDLRREMNDRDIHVQDDKIEALVDLYEKKNLELEEREMEVRYRLQMLENTMPALMMWNIWKMMMTIQGGTGSLAVGPSGVPIAASDMGPKEVDEFSEMNNIDTVNTKEEELIMKLKQLETKLNTQNKILADSKATEDSLRVKLQQLENWMTGGNVPPLMVKDLDTDVEMFEKLSKMAKDRMDMDKRIKDLELKEKVFKETLEQADNMIAQLEAQFRTQLNDKDQELNETSARLRDSETKLKVAEKTNSQTLAMQDRITLLESAVDKLKKTLQARDREKERLEDEYGKLLKEVERSVEDLEATRNELEAAKKRLESTKKASKQLEDELRSAEVEREAAYGAQRAEVNSLKNQISQLQRDLMENEVTISELKEEVLTLESAVDELRYTARLEKAEKEELTKNFEAQLEMKEKELEEAKKELGGGDENVRSIMEELEEGEKNAKGGHKFPWTLAKGSREVVGEVVHCYPAEVDHLTKAVPPSEPIKEPKVKRPTVSPPPPPVPMTGLSVTQAQEPPVRLLGTGPSKSPARWHEHTGLDQYELKNMTAAQFRAFITLIEEGEPHVDVMSTKGIPLNSAYLNNNLPIECQEAHEAVKEISGKTAKLTVEALSKAYNHSKICGDCNERLGSFVGEIVQKLGVRMPRIKDAEDICEHGGAPSNLKTKEVGPGSVGWDPKSSAGGYKVKPTMTGLLMAAEELKDKCRLKDAMIEALADELKDLERRGRWNAHRVLRELTLHPNPSPIDFNRQTLSRYINNEPIDGFDDRDENGKEYFATNPLGLTIVRRVGPDSLLLKWLPIADPKITSYEIYANGLLMQRVMSPGRNKALLHPIDLDKKMLITLNALTYDGNKEESATVAYKK